MITAVQHRKIAPTRLPHGALLHELKADPLGLSPLVGAVFDVNLLTIAQIRPQAFAKDHWIVFDDLVGRLQNALRSEEHTSELRHVAISYAVFCLKKKIKT